MHALDGAAPDVKVIVVYVEAVRNGTRFVQALELAQQPQGGDRTEGGPLGGWRRAAASHTGAFAGEGRHLRRCAVAARCLPGRFHGRGGGHRLCVRTGRYLVSRKIGVVTLSGGVGVQIADAADAHGLELPAMPDEAQRRIKEMIPFAGTGNPIDVTGQNSNDRSLLGVASRSP